MLRLGQRDNIRLKYKLRFLIFECLFSNTYVLFDNNKWLPLIFCYIFALLRIFQHFYIFTSIFYHSFPTKLPETILKFSMIYR